MTFRVRVEHLSRYRYASKVHSSYNEVRITPLTTPWQLVLDSRIQVQPNAPLQGYVDYWGSVVHAFDLHQPHAEMVIEGRSVVETDRRPGREEATIRWEELHAAEVRDRFAELLAPTGQVPLDESLEEVTSGLAACPDPASAAESAVQWVHDQLRYVPGTTGVHTTAIEALKGGEGVCQDFAHLTLAVLRRAGIPSRYCSGYAHPVGEAAVGEPVRGESHAWIEYWAGDWVAMDPTAGGPAGDRHVLVARGRDYSDVTPVKGIFHGGPTSALEVAVTLTRLA